MYIHHSNFELSYKEMKINDFLPAALLEDFDII